MDLTISSPNARHHIAVAWISIDTTAGNFTILGGHAPTILQLKPHSVVVMGFSNETQETLLAPGGVVEVSRTGATILLTT
jgi:F0F1-type ATP synthase epsilon subunit